MRKIVFGFIAICISVFILIISETVLRVADYGDSTALFIPASEPFSGYKQCNPNVGNRFFNKQSTIPTPSNDVFLAEKPDDCYRIFVLGGSTALGFPYGNNLMFSRILSRRLQDTFPGRKIEVVNTALTAVNSFTILDFMDEIIDEKPDLLLIYSGHNEYYGALGVASLEAAGFGRFMTLTFLKLNRLKIFRLMRDIVDILVGTFTNNTPKSDYNPDGTLMERLVSEQHIEYKGELFYNGKVQFESNLRSIYQKAQEAKVPIIISELVSNLRDMEPFVTSAQSKLSETYKVYSVARQFESMQNYAAAKENYFRAKDLDGLRFRAPEIFNELIHDVAAENNLPVVPMKSVFESSSPNGLIGDNLLTDHLHPNIDGNFLMADAFFKSILSNQFISEKLDSVFVLSSDYYRNMWPITALDSALGSLMIRHLKAGWPFAPDQTKNKFLADLVPSSLAESLAREVIFNEIGLADAHLIIARKYKNTNQIELANLEYDALACLLPIEAYSYLNRGRAFLRAGKYKEALSLLEKSLKLEEIPLARQLVKEIYLKFGNEIDNIVLTRK